MGSHQNKNLNHPFPDARRNIIQEIFHAPITPLPIPRKRLARAQGNTQWILQIPHWDLDASQQSITSWVLLAQYETGCTRVGEQICEMPKPCYPHTPTSRTPQCHAIIVPFLPMGDGHSRTISTCNRAKEIPSSYHRLLHKMGRGKTSSPYH
ncbi:UNVERIFIED_CONTAM: hypothetical protein Sangu_0675800 [Sesamum angustifolium]|uniref:Uncharacterized protein n=1 Tax=Sesamum angustifolium TaxID=2727405 RepID=A0AAW2PPP3_9LAMI